MIENILWMDYANDWRSSDWKISYLFRVQIHINYHVIGHILLLMIILNDWAFHATFIVKTMTEYINETKKHFNCFQMDYWLYLICQYLYIIDRWENWVKKNMEMRDDSRPRRSYKKNGIRFTRFQIQFAWSKGLPSPAKCGHWISCSLKCVIGANKQDKRCLNCDCLASPIEMCKPKIDNVTALTYWQTIKQLWWSCNLCMHRRIMLQRNKLCCTDLFG